MRFRSSDLFPILCVGNQLFGCGYDILFKDEEEKRICSCVYPCPVFCLEDQHTSVDQPDGIHTEVESVQVEPKLQELPVFSGGACAL